MVAAGSRPTNPPRRTACTCTSPGQPPGCSPIAVFGTSPNLNTIQLEASGGPGAGTGAIGPNNSVTITSEDNLHQINGTTTCIGVDAVGVSATMLFRVTSALGNPPGLYGILVRVKDDSQLGDRLDITNFNEAQYNRQFIAGCATTSILTPRAALAAGNIAVRRVNPGPR